MKKLSVCSLAMGIWVMALGFGKVKSMASTAYNRKSTQINKTLGFIMSHSKVRDKERPFWCQGWWKHQAQ